MVGTNAARVAASLLLLAACGGGAHDALSDSCVEHINSLRASAGLGPLARWSDGESCADAEARSDSETGEAHGAFGQCGESAQNECPGWSSMAGPHGIVPGCLDMMWSEGPGGGHYDNMTRSSYTRVACGFHQTPSGEIWAVQNFR